jgi:hypothetical protein
VETVLTGSSDGEHDLGRMPSSDTSDLSETLVGLSRKLLGTPSSGNTLESVTLGDTDDVDDLMNAGAGETDELKGSKVRSKLVEKENAPRPARRRT